MVIVSKDFWTLDLLAFLKDSFALMVSGGMSSVIVDVSTEEKHYN